MTKFDYPKPMMFLLCLVYTTSYLILVPIHSSTINVFLYLLKYHQIILIFLEKENTNKETKIVRWIILHFHLIQVGIILKLALARLYFQECIYRFNLCCWFTLSVLSFVEFVENLSISWLPKVTWLGVWCYEIAKSSLMLNMH